MKIVIFGANGMLGRYLYVYLSRTHQCEVIGITRKIFDAYESNILELDNLLKKLSCDDQTIIINCIGLIPQRTRMETQNTEKFLKVNTMFPILLGTLRSKYFYQYIHITTDCVYDGCKQNDNEGGNYTELDPPTETNDYGRSKALGELCLGTVIRTSIIGEEIENKKSLLEWAVSQKGKSVKGFDDHRWNGVTCLQLAKIISSMILENNFWLGVRHIYSPNIVTKYELLVIINEIYQLDLNITRHKSDKICDKTLSSIHEDDINSEIPDLKQQITELRLFTLCYPLRCELSLYHEEYVNNQPFPHIVIDHALNLSMATQIRKEIMAIEESEFDRYSNPFEQKLTLRDKNHLPPYCSQLFQYLTSEDFVSQLSKCVGIQLVNDEYKHYWGIHKYEKGDKLDIHVDAGIHPFNLKKKCVTVGFYFSDDDWKDEYGGFLELWKGDKASLEDPQIDRCVKCIAPLFNRMIIFTNTDYSWHGSPDPLECPDDVCRAFLTISYLSDYVDPLDNQRQRAFFCPRPDESENAISLKNQLKNLRASNDYCANIYRYSSNL